jgi:hypothetical protein
MARLWRCSDCVSALLPGTVHPVRPDVARRRSVLLLLRTASMPLSAPRYGQVALVKKYARWCEEMLLVALPAHPDVINLYLQHRLHEDGVDTSTTELDVQAISAWHISAQVAFQKSSAPACTSPSLVTSLGGFRSSPPCSSTTPLSRWSTPSSSSLASATSLRPRSLRPHSLPAHDFPHPFFRLMTVRCSGLTGCSACDTRWRCLWGNGWTRQPKMTASGAEFESPGAPSLAACGRFTNLQFNTYLFILNRQRGWPTSATAGID